MDITTRHLFCCALLAVVMTVCDAQVLNNLPPRFEQWLQTREMRHATVAVEIVDLDRDSLIFAYDEQRSVQPASILKLVTTGAALHLLGADYVIPKMVCGPDSTVVPLPELVGYNPDWLIEDVASSYAEPLVEVPDSGLTLREYIKKTNEKSLNIHAEALAYLLSPDQTLKSGLDSIGQFWQRMGIDTEALVMYDACGLAPADRITAHMMTQLLHVMKDDEDFRQSFAVAGLTGTVSYFLKASYLCGRAQLKTGTTKSVCGYAGYVRGSNNHTYSVVLIVNNSTSPLTLLRKNIEKMFNYLIP